VWVEPRHQAEKKTNPNHNLEEFVLKSHVVLRLQTNTSPEDVGKCSTLLGKSINDRGSRRSQRCLENVSHARDNRVCRSHLTFSM